MLEAVYDMIEAMIYGDKEGGDLMSNKNSKVLLAERVINAPVGAVWNAWADGDKVAQWWVVEPLKRMVVTEYDFHPGGTWRQHGIDADGNAVGEHNAGTVFVKIVPNKMIVTTPKPTDEEFIEIVPDAQRTIIEFDSLSDSSARVAMYVERSGNNDWQPNELLTSMYGEIFDNMRQWVMNGGAVDAGEDT